MRSVHRWVIGCLTGLVLAAPAYASEWEWGIAPYLWASDMSVDVSLNGQDVGGGDLGFSDILDKLDMAFQIHLEARRGRFGLFGDLTYLNTGDSFDIDATPNLPVSTEVDTDVKTTLFEAAGTLRPIDAETPFELFAGIRVIALDLDIELTFSDPNLGPFDLGGSDELVDVFAGARFIAPLSERFFLALRGDIGTGDTDFTYNLMGTLGMQFGGRQQFAALLAYRHMKVELKDSVDDIRVETDMTMSGPMLGMLFRF